MKRSEITKQKLFEAAEAEFCEKGLYGSRVDAIAENAGVNKRMIYEYYGNKESLYTAVLLGVYERLANLEVNLLKDEKDCEKAIRDLIFMYFDFLKSNPSFVKMIMWENLCDAQHLNNADIHNVKDPATEALKELIRRGKSSGIFSENVDEQQVILSLHTVLVK
jgi:TetR/AcrR family transcriptional regulator